MTIISALVLYIILGQLLMGLVSIYDEYLPFWALFVLQLIFMPVVMLLIATKVYTDSRKRKMAKRELDE